MCSGRSVVIVSLGPNTIGSGGGGSDSTAVGPSGLVVSAANAGGVSRSMRSLDVSGSGHGPCSPKHRVSIVAATAHSLDTSLDAVAAAAADADYGAGTVGHLIQHQQSLDQAPSSSSTGASAALAPTRIAIDLAELPDIVAESLEAMLEVKAVREKRLEMEKKLDTLRKKHDKEKVKVAAALRSAAGEMGDGSGRKTKFYMNNKLVKRLSSKNM